MFGQRVQSDKPIPYEEIPDGVYLLNRPAETLAPFRHYGTLFVGESAGYFGGSNLVIVEQTYPGIRVENAVNTGAWDLVGQVQPELENDAVVRAFGSLQDPSYDFLKNNCEQVARYITEGKKTSTQLVGVGLAAATVFAIWLINRSEN